jgi:penicillin-binding protein 2
MVDVGVSRLRLTVVGVVVISLFAALLTRLWYLTVLDSPGLAAEAKKNEIRPLCESAPRGRILDRTGKVLVDNELTTAVTLSRADAKQHPEDLPRLSALLGVAVPDLQKRLDDPRYTGLKPIPIAFDVPDDKVIFIEEHAEEYPGVAAQPLATRRYPLGRLASHVLGTVGPVTQAELHARGADVGNTGDPIKDCDRYGQNDEIGKTGVESSFESSLRGTPGVVELEVDRSGKVVSSRTLREPKAGDDVVLTLDADLQQTVEDSLKQGLLVARTKRETKFDTANLRAPGGSATVVDSTDGSVLAMASYPDFAPADFVGGISQQDFQAYNDDPNKPLNNRAIQGLYPPASTFKLPMSVAALTKGVIPSPQWTYVDTGTYTIPGQCAGRCKFQNSGGGQAHGRINLSSALTVSSDTFFYNVGANFWITRKQAGLSDTAMQDVARAFGLGSKTGIPLASEAGGRVSDPNVRKKLHDANPQVFPDPQWRTGDSVITAIGQGETVVTPLQLAMEYATFANGGTLYSARIAQQVKDPDGTIAKDLGPNVRSTIDIPQAVRDPIVAGLRGVVANQAGTAYGAFQGYSGMSVAGKTGTAQQTHAQDTAVFCSFGPVEAPRYAISVVLEEAGFGGTTAAPVARRIWEHLSNPTKPLGDVRAGDSQD